MQIFENGRDNGYMDDLNWWDNPSNPQAFRIGKLSDDYPEMYFNNGHGLDNGVINSYCNYVPEYFEKITKRKLATIVEYGSAGAWFSNRFKQLGYQIQTLDGADGATSQIKRDFRKVAFKEPPLVKPYDIALCTEVAEHLEPPFAGILVHNLICESDVIWWSSAVRGRGKPHLHHPNEQPIQYWINLYDFHGYGCYMLSDEINEACGSRGRCLFYNKSVYTEKID